ncbi:MAG: FG-GAP-like repeat-containing protein [Candidatus Anammoxibacter sp.]
MGRRYNKTILLLVALMFAFGGITIGLTVGTHASITLTSDTAAAVTLNWQGMSSVSSAGDFNGDGIEDVIVGAPSQSNNSGRAFIFFGGKTGTFRADTDADVILNGQNEGDQFGISVSTAGDFNGDGIDDVIVGAYRDDNNGTDSGSAYIFFGGITGTFNSDTDADVILNGQDAKNLFGWSVSTAGDFNGDGKDDVIVGAWRDENNGNESGSAFIFFGQTPTSQLTLSADTDADVILNGQDAGDQFGYSVSTAGDFNGDGIDDVIVGADSANIDRLVGPFGGAYIFFGGITGTFNSDTDADVIFIGQQNDGFFGKSVSTAGDFNGDGIDDVIVGAPEGFNSRGATFAGNAFIFFGGITGTFDSGTDADVKFIGGDGDQLGNSVSTAGDFNGDGIDDVIFGTATGLAYIFFGGKTGILDVGTGADVILKGQSALDKFGFSVSTTGDFNSDGIDDVIVVAWRLGSAFIFFGSSKSTSSSTSTTTTTIDLLTTTTTLPPTLRTGEVWQLDNFFTNVLINGTPQVPNDTGAVTVTTIKVGDTVKWTNKGTTEHTATNDDITGVLFQGDLWDSGDMGVGETFSHSKTFEKEGEFPYFCKIHGRDDMAGTIIVKSSIAVTAPIANFIADQPLGIVPLTVRFTDISTGNPTPTEWLWDFGDGGASIEPNPSHVYSIPGLYSVALTVKNSLGEDSLTKTDFINAQSFFDKSFTFNCEQNMKRGFFGLESLTMNVGDIENCTLKLTNHKQGQTKEVSTQITNWFWSGIKIEPARSVTDENGELRITITAIKKGADWAAWAVPNDRGLFQFNKKTYDTGLAWGMFVEVK